MPVLLDGEEEEVPSSTSLLLVNSINHNSNRIVEQQFEQEKHPNIFALGRALHLLLNVKVSVIDVAIATLDRAKSADDAEFIATLSESPVVKAIYSIDQYMKRDKDNGHRFNDIYEPLRGRILSKNPAPSVLATLRYLLLRYTSVQEWLLVHELVQCDDRKRQLAVIILLQFVFQHQEQPRPVSILRGIAISYLTPLTDIVKRLGGTPTYLSCLACELAIDFCKYVLCGAEIVDDNNPSQPRPNSIHSTMEQQSTTAKIVEVLQEEDNATNDIPLHIWDAMNDLVSVLEQWYNPVSPIEKAAYCDLHQFIQQQQHNQIDWASFWIQFTPKRVLSKKLLPVKKQKQLLREKSQSGFLILCLFERKACWIEHFGGDKVKEKEKTLDAKEEEMNEIGRLLQTTCRDLINQATTSANIQLPNIIPQLIMNVPDICPAQDIHDPRLIQHVLHATNYSSLISPMIMNQVEPTLSHLVWVLLERAGTQEAAAVYRLLHCILYQNPSEQVMYALEKHLLTVAWQSDDACKLLIECMPCLDLPALIKKIIYRLVDVAHIEKERMIYCALISKALLQEKWAHYSILWYLDYLRELEIKKSIEEPIEQQMQRANPSLLPKLLNSPSAAVAKMAHSKSTASVTMQTWTIPIQLWGLKQKDTKIYTSVIRQLVTYSYGLPHDPQLPEKLIWIPTWHQLSFGFFSDDDDKALTTAQTLIQCCLELLIRLEHVHFSEKDNAGERLAFLKICPMLILQSVRQEVFALVALPESFVTIVADRLSLQYGIEGKNIKTTTDESSHTMLYIQLMEVLLNRPFVEPKELTQLAKNLVIKIFCKQ